MRVLLAFCCFVSVFGTLAMAQEAQTLKERLSDKASDAQRVDNCRVPLARRGAAPRPDCPDKPEAMPRRGGADQSAPQSTR